MVARTFPCRLSRLSSTATDTLYSKLGIRVCLWVYMCLYVCFCGFYIYISVCVYMWVYMYIRVYVLVHLCGFYMNTSISISVLMSSPGVYKCLHRCPHGQGDFPHALSEARPPGAVVAVDLCVCVCVYV
jgi:hypothetical protein